MEPPRKTMEIFYRHTEFSHFNVLSNKILVLGLYHRVLFGNGKEKTLCRQQTRNWHRQLNQILMNLRSTRFLWHQGISGKELSLLTVGVFDRDVNSFTFHQGVSLLTSVQSSIRSFSKSRMPKGLFETVPCTGLVLDTIYLLPNKHSTEIYKSRAFL